MSTNVSREAAVIGAGVGVMVLWGLLRPRGIGGEISRAAIRSLYQPAAFIPAAAPAPSGPFTLVATYRVRSRDVTQALRWDGSLEGAAGVVAQLASCNLYLEAGTVRMADADNLDDAHTVQQWRPLIAIDCWRIVVRRGPHILSQYQRAPRVAPGRTWVNRGRKLIDLNRVRAICGAPFCTGNPELVAQGARDCMAAM